MRCRRCSRGPRRAGSTRPTRRSWPSSSSRSSLRALAARAEREPRDRGEHWCWRIALTGYGIAAAGLVGVFVALIPGRADSSALNVVFFALLLPGLLLSTLGSTVLGVVILRGDYRPRATAWLLTLALPAMVAAQAVLGHNSFGILPIMLAWGSTGLGLRRVRAGAPAVSVGSVSTLVALALLLAVTATAALASGGKTAAQRFVIFTADQRGKDLPAVVEATGPVSGIARETQTDKDTRGGQINYAILHFPRGTLRIVAPERFSQKIDLHACTATADGHGTWKITGGTGAYRGISGKGTFISPGAILGERSKAGACLGPKAPPVVNYVTVILTGAVTR